MLSLRESCQAIRDAAIKYAGNSPWNLCLSLAAFLYLMIASRHFRKRLLLPGIALILLVFNPVLYSLVYGNNSLPFVASYGLRYWRFFWMLPQGILIGLAAVDIVRRLPLAPLRCVALAAAAAIIVAMAGGSTLYDNEEIFTPAQSAYKLSGSTSMILETILEDDPLPVCLFDKSLSAQARVYSANIRQVWGRDGTWSIIPDPEAVEVYGVLRTKPRDWERIFTFANQRGVTHLSFKVQKSENRKEMVAVAKQHGYAVLKRTGSRYILHPLAE